MREKSPICSLGSISDAYCHLPESHDALFLETFGFILH